MTRKRDDEATGTGPLRRVANAVKRLFGRGGESEGAAETRDAAAGRRPEPSAPVRTTRRKADIPMDVVENSYTPPRTSSKAGFRADGADHQEDQEFAIGASDERWKDEDHYTNRSGDPRIGTHKRTYEPGESVQSSDK